MCYIIWIVAAYMIQVLDAYTNYTTRITGGKETTIEKFPYHVAVFCEDTSTVALCGGALLNKKTVLTAAHCVYDCNEDNLLVMAGTSEIDKKYLHKVNSVIIHEDFQQGEVGYDIAVVCLESVLRYSNRIQPISLTEKLYPEGTVAVVTGWGRLNNKQEIPKKLRYANVNVINNRHCKVINPLIDETQLCTNGDGIGPCKGDSGGPLVANKKLIGLVSYGDIDCTSKMVRMYTNMYRFRRFVQDNLC